MVRILRNSFAADRMAHAYILTGVRGVGKTTTARIIAKGLNCTTPKKDGAFDPCGKCGDCTAIAEARHVDVIEMDAASRTGVNDIRDIIESIPYRPVAGRYKIFIIDEVHMLSTNAFNALLKTLEEPPEHVKFVFATTEIRMVPVTVLSRCQRFDLRRIEPQTMSSHLASVAERENINLSEDAVSLIARASEGSARDAISLLDQAVAHGGGKIEAADVRDMLGLADRGRTLDLFEQIMKGDIAQALQELDGQYRDGADPHAVLRDLAETTHWISILNVSPDTARDVAVSPAEADRGVAFAKELPIRVLSRAWQMLLKSIEEAAMAPSAIMAAEMAVIRLCYVAELPTPEALIRKLSGGEALSGQSTVSETARNSEKAQSDPVRTPAPPRGRTTTEKSVRHQQTKVVSSEDDQALPSKDAAEDIDAICKAKASAIESPPTVIESVEDIRNLLSARQKEKLASDFEKTAHTVKLTPGRVRMEKAHGVFTEFSEELSAIISDATGDFWQVEIIDRESVEGAEAKDGERDLRGAPDMGHELLESVMRVFPESKVIRRPIDSLDGN